MDYCSNMPAVEAKMKLRNYIRECIEPEIVNLAEAEGHQAVFSPPYYSDLQPIELVWARIKNSIGRQYTRGITFQDVKNKLEVEFKNLSTDSGRDSISRILSHVDKVIEKFFDEIRAAEELEATESDSDCNSDESNSSTSTIDLVI